MEYLIPIATCLFVAVVSSLLAYSHGRSDQAWEDTERIQGAYSSADKVEIYSDDENEEATLFITLVEDKPAYTVTEIVLNDGESLRLYREERTV